MPTAFSPQADLSGLDNAHDLFISSVVHQAFVDVNEEGTEAAAATGAVMGITSVAAPPPVFRVDHPFLFLIRENQTGSILFLGRVVDPERVVGGVGEVATVCDLVMAGDCNHDLHCWCFGRREEMALDSKLIVDGALYDGPGATLFVLSGQEA